MTSLIHPTAQIDSTAQIDPTATVGPYCCVGPNVVLGPNVQLLSHVVIVRDTTLGAGCVVHPFAVLGSDPQFLRYANQPTRLDIGANTTIREHATFHRGTEEGGGITRVGTNGLFMVGVHIAHDCQIGNHVIMANNATLGGHVHVGDHAYIGGLAAVHQFVRIGHQAMIGGTTGVEADVIPFGTVMGERGHLAGLNVVGMKRRGLDHATIHAVRRAYGLLFAAEGTLAERLTQVHAAYADTPQVHDIVAFMTTESHRSFCVPK